jgi:hypothetical protein
MQNVSIRVEAAPEREYYLSGNDHQGKTKRPVVSPQIFTGFVPNSFSKGRHGTTASSC